MSELRNEDHDTSPSNATQTSQQGVNGVAEEATSLLEKAKDGATTALVSQKDNIADQIERVADSVHQSSAQFEGKQDWIANAIDRGAAELGTLATALRDNDLSTLLKRTQAIARQQPALFIGASLAAGFAVARLGKLVAADISNDDLPSVSGGDDASA